MLQQTQVKTMVPYFERWMKRFPDIASLASASEQDVLKHWEGLGYYSRARNLKKAAEILVNRNGGRLYDSYEALLTLPGIGQYTAGAILSIAFNRDFPVVDGNVIRVISRLLCFEGNTRESENTMRFWGWAEKLLAHGSAREFNQAMMELGALVCTPRSPQCGECPLQKSCRAFKAGKAETLPNRGIKTETEHLDVAVAVVRKGGKVFIQRRRAEGLMAGLWEFPGGKIEAGEAPEAAVRREIKEELNWQLSGVRPVTVIRHAYTRFKVTLHCFEARYQKGRTVLRAAEEGRWVAWEELKRFPFPAANVRLIHHLSGSHQSSFSS